MKEITEALSAKHAQIEKLQRDIDALQKAADILGGGEGQGEGHNQDQGHRCSAQGHAETVDYGCRGQKGRLQANEGVLGETEEGQAVTECDLLLGPECFHRIHACHSTRCKPDRQDPDPHQPDGSGSKRLRIGCRHAEQQR